MSEQKDPVAVVKYQLAAFQINKGEDITEDTVAGPHLSRTDGPSKFVNSYQNFKNFINLSLHRQDKPLLPDGWDKFTVKQIASLLLMMVLFVSAGIGQTGLSIGAGKSNGNPLLAVGIEWAQNQDSIFNSKTYFYGGKNSFVTFAPNIDVQTAVDRTGVADLFSSINLRATGTLTTFKNKEVGGYSIPDANRTFWLFPFSVGVEADNTFKKINGIGEIGVVPWYQGNYNTLPDAIKHTKIGLFVQGGRKFYQDADPEKSILRARGSFSIDSKKLAELQGIGVGVTGTADGWYDFLNTHTYYKVYFSGDLYLNGLNKFSFFYQRGVGAPNFYEGELFGLALKVKL